MPLPPCTTDAAVRWLLFAIAMCAILNMAKWRPRITLLDASGIEASASAAEGASRTQSQDSRGSAKQRDGSRSSTTTNGDTGSGAQLEAALHVYKIEASPLRHEVAIIQLGRLAAVGANATRLEQAVVMFHAAYGRHFKAVVFTGASLKSAQRRSSPGEHVILWPCEATPQVCAAQVLDLMQGRGRFHGVRGVIAFSADFWLHPSYLSSLLASKNGTLVRGAHVDSAESSCSDVKTFSETTWAVQQVQTGVLQLHTLEQLAQRFNTIEQQFFPELRSKKAPLLQQRPEAALCHNVVDLYRIPRAFWAYFSAAAAVLPGVPRPKVALQQVLLSTTLKRLSSLSGHHFAEMSCPSAAAAAAWADTRAGSGSATALPGVATAAATATAATDTLVASASSTPCGHVEAKVLLDAPEAVRLAFVRALEGG